MTITIIILVILIIVFLYMGISYLNPDYIIYSAIELNRPNSRHSIPEKSIEAPGSIRYFYEAWVYIDENTPVDKHNVLFNRSNDFVVTLKGSTLSIYADPSAPAVDSRGIYNPIANPSMFLEVTKTFPFQKWVQLFINVDGRTIDVYLDGRLVKTAIMPNTLNIHSNASIDIGNANTRGKIGKFRRVAKNLSPQDVYLASSLGSGQGASSSNDYRVNVGIMQDGVTKREFKLF